MARASRAASVFVATICVCLVTGSHALGQAYPTRAVTLVVPYPPGGGVDALARVVAERLSGVLGKQVVVDNRAGGSGLVGTRSFIRSAPDGTDTPCSWDTPGRSPSIPVSTPKPVSTRAGISRPSA